ncbi:MAG: hypothetical protein DI535_26340 [Citrobacter freundii]|nr:MAG: hypothetical protein DI535_26340 [Citrobacter freundii]
MKRILVLCVVISISFSVVAQRSLNLTDASVVKDTSGKVLATHEWKTIIASGRYSLRTETPGGYDGPFIIRVLSDEEVKQRINNSPAPRVSPFFITGRKAMSFNARDLNGINYKLKDLQGKIVVLNFWFIGCLPCRQEMPELNKLADEYKDSTNIVFLAIALDEKTQVQSFLQKSPFHYNVISDGQYIASMYGINSFPTHVVLDKAGKVLFHTTGYGAGTVPWVRKTVVGAMR